MFFILSKIFVFVFSPLFWIVLIAILALIFYKTKHGKRLFISAIIMLLFFTNSFILDEAMRMWEPKAKQKQDLKSNYEYGIVLTGMLSFDDKYQRINFKSSADRIFQAIELYKENKIKKIFISGGSGEVFNQKHKEANILKNYLITIGITPEDIEIDSISRNTYENAVETSKMLKQYGNHECLLITSAFHMPRSEKCFIKQNMNCDTYVTDRYAGKRKFDIEHLVVPNPSALNTWHVLLHEIGGYIIYKITGKL